MATKKSSTTPANHNPSPAAAPAASTVITSTSSPKVTTATDKVASEVNYQTLVQNLPVIFAGEDSFPLPSGTYTLAQVLAPLQAAIAALENTKTTENAWHDSVAAAKPVVEDAEAMRKEVKGMAAGRFGASSGTLAKLGFEPAKEREVSAETKAAAAAKSRATRAAKKAAKAQTPKSGS